MSTRILLLILISSTLTITSRSSITCMEVAQMITPCMGFLGRRAFSPYGPCCNGVVSLNQTTVQIEDRVLACNCLRIISYRLPRFDIRRAAALPRICGVNLVNVTISPWFDCNSLALP